MNQRKGTDNSLFNLWSKNHWASTLIIVETYRQTTRTVHYLVIVFEKDIIIMIQKKRYWSCFLHSLILYSLKIHSENYGDVLTDYPGRKVYYLVMVFETKNHIMRNTKIDRQCSCYLQKESHSDRWLKR